jgi:hypothetical protein
MKAPLRGAALAGLLVVFSGAVADAQSFSGQGYRHLPPNGNPGPFPPSTGHGRPGVGNGYQGHWSGGWGVPYGGFYHPWGGIYRGFPSSGSGGVWYGGYPWRGYGGRR